MTDTNPRAIYISILKQDQGAVALYTHARCPRCYGYFSHTTPNCIHPSYYNPCICTCSMPLYPVGYPFCYSAGLPYTHSAPPILLSQKQEFIPVIIQFNIPALLEKFPGLKGEELKNHPYRQELKTKYMDWINQIKEKTNAPSMNIRYTLNLLVSGIAVTLTKEKLEKLEDLQLPFIKAIYPDEKTITDTKSITYHHPRIQQETNLNQHNLEIIGIPQVLEMRDAHGHPLSGRLVRVAVLELNFDLERIRFGPEGRVVEKYNLQDKTEEVFTPGAGGHGTMVTQIILDVAPNAQIVAYKTPSTADITAGLERAVESGVEVVNMSLWPYRNLDLITKAAETAVANNVVIVSASGNESREYRVTVPGNSPFILSVGATNEGGDQVADFSNYDQMLLKPDVVAPGYYQFEFETYDGTSQAAPYVSGAIALILQMHPDWTPAQVMSALATTATPVRERDPFAIFSQGSGRIDVPLAIQTDTLISPIHIALDTFIGVEKQVTLRIENKSNLEKTYSIHWQAKGGGILISFPEIVTIPAGESQELPLSISSAESQKSSEEIQLISGEMRWHIPIQIIPVSSR